MGASRPFAGCGVCTVQCVELDFHYPSEGIHKRWDAGYRVTCGAATPDQSAFVLSQMKRVSQDETQVGLCVRTSMCAWVCSHPSQLDVAEGHCGSLGKCTASMLDCWSWGLRDTSTPGLLEKTKQVCTEV